MKEFQATMGDDFKPAALLERLVAEGKKFADFKQPQKVAEPA
jgi:3-hydroxyacyl-CoA dehydrogenase